MSFLSKFFGAKNIISHAHTTKDNNQSKTLLRQTYIIVSKILIKMFSDKRLACGIKAGQVLYGKDDKTIIVNNGINLDEYKENIDIEKFKNENNISINKYIIGHVGRFSAVKNHAFIIKLAEELYKNNFDFEMVLIGNGEEEQNIQKLIRESKIENKFKILGLRNDVIKCLQMFDLFILPSFYEGFPVTLIEAQTLGLPCIVSNKISSEVNLNINTFEFIKLDVQMWVEYIMNSLPKKINKDTSIQKISKSEFNIVAVCDKLKKIYKNET